MIILSLAVSITSLAVNLYTLWSVRQVLKQGARKAAEEVKDIINKI